MNAKLPPQGKAAPADVPLLAGRYARERELVVRPLVTAYRAVDLAARRTVIVETLDDALIQDPGLRARLEAEARRAATLRHDNLIAFHDLCLDNGAAFAVRENVDGETLTDYLTRAGRPLPLFEVLQVAEQTATALSAAHRAGVLHRSINPHNILLRWDGRVLLSGLGLPSLAGISTEAELDPLYLSPEQCAGRSLDARTDSYALAAMTFAMCTGRPPFTGEEPVCPGATPWERVEWETMNAPPPFAAKVNRDLPREVAWVLHKGLAKKADERFRSPADFLVALERGMVEAGLDPEAMRKEPPGWQREAHSTTRSAIPFLKRVKPKEPKTPEVAKNPKASDVSKPAEVLRRGRTSGVSPNGKTSEISKISQVSTAASTTQALAAVPVSAATTGQMPVVTLERKGDTRSGPLMWLGGLLLLAVVIWAALLALLLVGEDASPSGALAVDASADSGQVFDLAALPTWTPPAIIQPTQPRVVSAAYQPPVVPPSSSGPSSPGALLYNAMRPPTGQFDWSGYVKGMQWRSYTDPRFGYALVYPATWALEHGDNVMRLYMPDRDAGVIVCSCGTRVADANQWSDRFLDMLRASFPDIKQVDRRPLNARWLSTLAAVPGEGDDVQITVLTSGSGQRGYAVAFVAWASDWQGARPLFDRIARDMRFP